jgi:ABC-2 type transport system permease protein
VRFGSVASFELRYQLRSPIFWAAAIAFGLLAFAATVLPQLRVGAHGATHVNSPDAIFRLLGILDVFFLFALTAFVANIVVRDDDTGFAAILRTTPITRFDYLIGRFAGAFGAVAVLALAMPLGILAGTLIPGGDPATLGAFRPEHYLFAYFVLVLPTSFALAAACFALATATRSMMATYLGAVTFLIVYFVLTGLGDKPQFGHLAALLDPFGNGAIAEATRYWTTADRDELLPLAGIVLVNRAIWIAVGVALLAMTYATFRIEPRAPRKLRRREPEGVARASTGVLPAPTFGFASLALTSWRWTRLEMAQVFKSPAFFVLLALGVLNALVSLVAATEHAYFTILPVTTVMIQTLETEFAILPTIVAIYYAGELVWRDRERRTHQLIDACPVPDWAFVVSKIAAIALVLVALFAISAATAVGVQVFKGYYAFEWPHYVSWYIVPGAIDAFELAVLAIFVQALSPHKYVGWGVMVLIQIALLALGSLGFEHHLYRYGTAPPVPLSDMNGQGTFWIARAWFHLYWSGFALVLTVLTYALWRRGTETRLRPRLARLPRRLRGVAGWIAALGLATWAGSGAYIYYNTNVLNEYRTRIADDDWTAEYERTLYPFHTLPTPRITEVVADVAIDPARRRVATTGHYTIQNKSAVPQDRVHVRWARDLQLDDLVVEGAHETQRFDRFHYVIYSFDRPLAPGETRTISFHTVWAQQGFDNRAGLTRIVGNGTYVDDRKILPLLGMDAYGLLTDPVERRRYDLPAELRPPSLDDASARATSYNATAADWVTTDLTVSTVAGQIPIAPGYVVSDVTRDGRRTVRFKSDAPIVYYFSIQSAAYAERHDRWHDVELGVYYDPHHPYEIDRVIAAVKVSFEVFTRVFGPYQFRQARFIEFPGYEDFAESYANTVPWSEHLGFIQDDRTLDDGSDIDMVTLVAAHELAHQWWGHQLVGANVQGVNMLMETFAHYSAMLVLEHVYGPAGVRRFLRKELDRYLRGRGGEELEELPLARVEDQPYIHYRKGVVTMYRLKQTVGEAVVDRAMRRMLERFAFRGAPFPVTTDFLQILREEAGPAYDALISDLFEHITLYDLHARSATWSPRTDGRYDVAVTVEAHKRYADGHGVETEAPMDEAIEIGAFLAEPDAAGADQVLALVPTQVVSGTQTIHLVTAAAPRFAGIDPYGECIDRSSDAHVVAATAR